MIIFPWLVPSDPASERSFQEHATQMTHISPTWYRMGPDGSIKGSEVSRPDTLSGIPVHPLIANEGFGVDVAASILQQPNKAVDAIVRLVETQGFSGVNIDFEGPFGAHRQAYTRFIEKLSNSLRSRSKVLSLDVVSQTQTPQGDGPGSWAAPYDYPALGELVDYLILMGYDFSSQYSPPGPVGPVFWLERVLDYTLSVVPSQKVILGLPFYGRHWTINPNGEYSQGRGVTHAQALMQAQHWEAEIQRSQEGPMIRHQGPDGITEVIYFDDQESLGVKLALAKRANLAGLAFWRLGQEDPEVWSALASLGEV